MPYPGFQALFSLFPQDTHFCLLPWPLPDYSLGIPSSTPGRPSFPTQPVTPLPAPRDSEETSYLGGQAGWCHSHSHHPDPSTPTSSAGSGPNASDAESDIQTRAWPAWLQGPHTAGHTHPHPRASLPTQAAHRHPPHTLCYTQEPPWRGHPAASACAETRLLSTQLT